MVAPSLSVALACHWPRVERRRRFGFGRWIAENTGKGARATLFRGESSSLLAPLLFDGAIPVDGAFEAFFEVDDGGISDGGLGE